MRAVPVLFVLVACGGNDSDLVFTPANNYAFSGELQVAETEVQPATDLTIDWSAISTDLRGRPFDGSVDQVMLISFRGISQEEILDKAVRNAIFQSDSDTQWLFDPEAADRSLVTSQFSIIGNEFLPTSELAEDPSLVWLVSITDLPDGRFDMLMSRFVTPVAASTETTVALVDGDTELIADVDMHSSKPLVTAEGTGPYTLDWSQIKEDVNGNAFDSFLGDELIIAKYDVDSISDVEALFLQLDEKAAELYRMSVYAVTDAELSEATTDDGKSFEGFTKDGVWLVGITCTTCISPVPMLISAVEVE